MGGMVVQPIFVATHGLRIADLAARNRLPTMSDPIEFVDRGGLMSYGPSRSALWQRAATYVDKIERRQAGQFSRRATDEIRVRHQFERSQTDRSHNTAERAGASG